MLNIDYKRNIVVININSDYFDFEELDESGFFNRRLGSDGYIYIDTTKDLFVRFVINIESSNQKHIINWIDATKYRFGKISGMFELFVMYTYTKLTKKTIDKLNSMLPQECDFVLYDMYYKLYYKNPETRNIKDVSDFPIFNNNIDITKYKRFLISGESIWHYYEFVSSYMNRNVDVTQIRRDFIDFVLTYHKKSHGIDLYTLEGWNFLDYNCITNKKTITPSISPGWEPLPFINSRFKLHTGIIYYKYDYDLFIVLENFYGNSHPRFLESIKPEIMIKIKNVEFKKLVWGDNE